MPAVESAHTYFGGVPCHDDGCSCGVKLWPSSSAYHLQDLSLTVLAEPVVGILLSGLHHHQVGGEVYTHSKSTGTNYRYRQYKTPSAVSEVRLG